jgi:[NiFe] hydrogenase assembly HybE family chaperone
MDAADVIASQLEDCFRQIHATRMQGVPILNQALGVKVVGMRRWQDHWLCVLCTPWFMNVVLLPLRPQTERLAIGTKQMFALPAGQFEFIYGEEEAIGPNWMCSLFSPVFEFADQASAELAAEAALKALFEPEEAASEAERDMAAIWRGDPAEADGNETPTEDVAEAAQDDKPELSRRAFLGGKVAEGQP